MGWFESSSERIELGFLIEFRRRDGLETSGLLGEKEEPTVVDGKMGGGGFINGGDYGDRFCFINLNFSGLELLAAATFTVRRVARHCRRMELGGWRRRVWSC